MPNSRFLHPYYIFNALLPLCYVLLRLQRLSPQSLAAADMFGVSREQQIYICLLLMLFARALSAPTLDAYLSSAFMFVRVTVLVCIWHMDPRLAALFFALWTVLYVVFPQPRVRLPSTVVALNDVSFRERILRNNHRTIYVVWCHAVWSSRCAQLSPVFAAVVRSYAHVRVKFATLDVAKYAGVADALEVSTSPTSKQLPAVICFKQGRELARLPLLNQAGNVPVQFARGFTAAQLAQQLQLDAMLKTAQQWEEEAQRKYVVNKRQ